MGPGLGAELGAGAEPEVGRGQGTFGRGKEMQTDGAMSISEFQV